MTTLFKLQFSLLAFSIIRSLASTSTVERDNLVAVNSAKFLTLTSEVYVWLMLYDIFHRYNGVKEF